jgi:hypothetical protein
MIQYTVYRVEDTGYSIHCTDTEYRLQYTGYSAQGRGYRIQYTG